MLCWSSRLHEFTLVGMQLQEFTGRWEAISLWSCIWSLLSIEASAVRVGFDGNCICRFILLHQLTLTNAIDLQINFESVNTHQECFRIWCIGFECRVAQFSVFLKYDAIWCIGFECRGVCTVFSVLEYDALARDAVQYFIRGSPPLTPPPFPCTA